MGISQLIAIPLILYVHSVSVVSIYIVNNAYKDMTISFSAGLQEQSIDFQKLKAVLIKSSEFLYHATKRRSYFKEFIISLPLSWTEDMCTHFTADVPHRVDVYVTDSSTETNLRAQHSRGCGEEGDLIYMPLSWLQGDTSELSRQFVQQWSVYRYGVFEEDPIDDEGACYHSKNSWSPVGCYNAKVNAEPIFKNGISVCPMNFDTFDGKQIESSLMFTSNLSKALNFCDGSTFYPHNPAMPTLHNNLCGGRNVWSVIEGSEDFKHGRNLPMDEMKPTVVPIFKCFREEPIHLTFAIQNNTRRKDLTRDITELRSALYHFLSSMSLAKFSANVVMFSDRNEASESMELDLIDENNLLEQMETNIRTARVITDNCLTCGFLRALNASQVKALSYNIVIVIAWESTLADEKPSELIKVMKEFSNIQVNLVLVEDTDGDAVSFELSKTIRSTGGKIHFVPMKYILMASKLHAILSSITKHPLKVEDKLIMVHEAAYPKVTETFVDSFTTINGEIGKMAYFIYCDSSLIKPMDPDCTPSKTKTTLDVFKCTKELQSVDNRVPVISWKFSHKYLVGTEPLYCTSVAMVIRSSFSENSYTLRGWLNKYEIRNDLDTLIIYAETIGNSHLEYQVKARISGPNFESTVELRDNGNGDPDVKGGDGIYSRYFIPRSLQKGAYIITISAELIFRETKGKHFANNEKPVENFYQKQTKTIGLFNVIASTLDVDYFPPNRIGDLKIVSIDHDNNSVTLQWTAPGNDFDNGTATTYEIKYSMHPASLQDLYFNAEENTLLRLKYNFTPSSSGTTEKVDVSFPKIYDKTYYVALRAIDGNENIGKVSNVIQLYINNSQTEVTKDLTDITEVTKLSSLAVSMTLENELSTSVRSTEDPTIPYTTVNPKVVEEEIFFDKKFIILASSAGGILILIIIINIIVCKCCIKQRKKSPESKKMTRKDSLRPPYNLNIAYQQDSPIFSNEEEDIGNSMSTLADQTIYTNPHPTNKSVPQRYSYHTSQSLLINAKSQDDNELGFKVVQTLPAYATSSLTRYARRLNELDVDCKKATAEPQTPSNATHIYPLGDV